MRASDLFGLLMGVNGILFLWEQYLCWRQYKVHKENETRPARIEHLITEENYYRVRQYNLERAQLRFLQELFGQVLSTIVLISGFMPFLWNVCAYSPLQSCSFIIVNCLLQFIFNLPWDLYGTFYIERKHGINEQTARSRITETMKKYALFTTMMSFMVLAVEWIVDNGGSYFFIYAWTLVSLVLFIFTIFYPTILSLLFDNYILLSDGDLKGSIEELAEKVHFPLSNIYVVSGSKRNTYGDIYMYGIWKNKTIVLYDTILELGERLKSLEKDRNDDEQDANFHEALATHNNEILAILGHELGHWAKSHVFWKIFIIQMNVLFMFWVFAYFYKWELLYEAFGFHNCDTIPGLFIVFIYVMAPYNQISSILISMHSRRCEFAADAYATDLGYGNSLCRALSKMNKADLCMPIDDHLFSLCTHSRPPVVERIEAIIEKTKKKE